MYSHGRSRPLKRPFTYEDCEHVPADHELPLDEYHFIADHERQDHVSHQGHNDAGYYTFRCGLQNFREVYTAAIANAESKRIIDSLGWDGFWTINPGNQARMVVEPIMRCWWDTTNSFQFYHLELGITPLDFTFLTGIPCGRGIPPPYDSKWHSMYDEVIDTYFPNLKRRVPKCLKSRSSGIDNSNLKKYITLASQDPTTTVEEGKEIARAFMMWCIGKIFFPNNSSIAHSGWVEALEDMDAVKDYDWGSAILARLYHSLGECCRCVKCCEGFSSLLEYWVYAYFATCTPSLTHKIGVQDTFPRIKSYDKDAMEPIQLDTGRRSFLSVCEQIDLRSRKSTIWQPYADSIYYHLDIVQQALEYSSKRVILFDPEKGIGTWYLGDRFWQQLYGVTSIPANPPQRNSLSYVPREIYWARAIAGWEHAEQYIVPVEDRRAIKKWWRRVTNKRKAPVMSRKKNRDVRGPANDEASQVPSVQPGELWFDHPDPPIDVDMSPYVQWTMDSYNEDGQLYSRPVTSVELATSYDPDEHTRDQWAHIASNQHDLNTMMRRMALEDSQRYNQSLQDKDRQMARLRAENNRYRRWQAYRSGTHTSTESPSEPWTSSHESPNISTDVVAETQFDGGDGSDFPEAFYPSPIPPLPSHGDFSAPGDQGFGSAYPTGGFYGFGSTVNPFGSAFHPYSTAGFASTSVNPFGAGTSSPVYRPTVVEQPPPVYPSTSYSQGLDAGDPWISELLGNQPDANLGSNH